MRWLKTFGAFLYDFIVGDDWSIAVGAVLAVAATSLVHHMGLAAWPVVPIVVAIMLTASIWRARPAKQRPRVSLPEETSGARLRPSRTSSPAVRKGDIDGRA